MPIPNPSLLHQKPLANLNKHELEKMAATLQQQYVVTVFEIPDSGWTLEFAFDGVQRYGVETVRRVLKTWHHMADAILFAQQNCQNMSTVIIEFKGWTFKKES